MGTMKDDAPEMRALLRHEERGRSVRPRTTAGAHHTCLRPEDFDAAPALPARLDVGRTPTLTRLRSQLYMPRPERVAAARAALEKRAAKTPIGCVRVFWIAGASGTGKTVLLLQLMEDLVRAGRRVLWIGGQPERLGESLRAEAAAAEFVFVDALYAPDARQSLDFADLGRLLHARGEAPWPVVVTCGEQEHLRAFRTDSRRCGFVARDWELGLATREEARQLLAWYAARRGHAQSVGLAFEHARRDEGRLVEMAFELEHDGLREFAIRFRQSAAGEVRHTLWQTLGLNRIGLGAPAEWLEHPYARGAMGPSGRPRFLAHPHVADALTRELRLTPRARANDLGDAFTRALRCEDEALAARLLRAFSDPLAAEPTSALAAVDLSHLAERCGASWRDRGATRAWRSASDRADALTSLACWSRRDATLAACEADGFVGSALAALDGAGARWPSLWLRLYREGLDPGRLVAWAAPVLCDARRFDHPQWSLVWESALETSHASPELRRALVECGRRWLAGRPEPVGRTAVQVVLDREAAMASLYAEGEDVACVVRRKLDALRDPSAREDWAQDWAHVYALTPHGDEQTRAELVHLGLNWLLCQVIRRGEMVAVIEGLLDLGSRDPRLLQRMQGWLRVRRQHPAWARMLARSLRMNPQAGWHTPLVAGLLGAPLTPAQRAELRRWLEPVAREVELPDALRSVLAACLAAVQEDTVDWARLREHQQTGGPVSAAVVRVVADGYVVDVGVPAHWRTTATERWQRGDEILMAVRKVDEESRYVVVQRHPDDLARAEYAQPRPDPAVVVGREVDAWVCLVQPYGVYVRFERRTALLRVEAMPEGCTPSSFVHGQTLRVAITAVTLKGIAVRLANPADS
jgi:hypothetical protein